MASDRHVSESFASDLPTRIAVAVVTWQGRFLVGRRAADTTLAGYDEFPGGKIKPGELVAVAARRECLEETGLAIECRDLMWVTKYHYQHGSVELHFVAANPIDDAEPIVREPFRWLCGDELAECRFPAANRPLIEWLRSPAALPRKRGRVDGGPDSPFHPEEEGT